MPSEKYYQVLAGLTKDMDAIEYAPTNEEAIKASRKFLHDLAKLTGNGAELHNAVVNLTLKNQRDRDKNPYIPQVVMWERDEPPISWDLKRGGPTVPRLWLVWNSGKAIGVDEIHGGVMIQKDRE